MRELPDKVVLLSIIATSQVSNALLNVIKYKSDSYTANAKVLICNASFVPSELKCNQPLKPPQQVRDKLSLQLK